MSHPRARYRDAGEAQRAATERACAARLSPLEWATFAAVLALTTSYSRVADDLSARRIAAVVYSVEPDDVESWHRRKITDALKALNRKGILRGETRKGRNAMWSVRVESRLPQGAIAEREMRPAADMNAPREVRVTRLAPTSSPAETQSPREETEKNPETERVAAVLDQIAAHRVDNAHSIRDRRAFEIAVRAEVRAQLEESVRKLVVMYPTDPVDAIAGAALGQPSSLGRHAQPSHDGDAKPVADGAARARAVRKGLTGRLRANASLTIDDSLRGRATSRTGAVASLTIVGSHDRALILGIGATQQKASAA